MRIMTQYDIYSLVTAEATTIRKNGIEYPCVILFGRDKDKVKRKWRTVYYPYCYINEKDYVKLKDEELDLDKYIKETMGTYKRSLTKKPLTKLIFNSQNVVTPFLRLLQKHQKEGYKDPIFTYEAELTKGSLLALRYLIDRNIRSGFYIEDDNAYPADAECELRLWLIDFEAHSIKMCGHGAKKEEPIMMASIYDNYEDCLYTFYTNNSKWSRRTKRLIKLYFKPQYKNHVIKAFNSEAKLLDYLVSLVISKDPDIISAWNLDRYDVVQLKYRMDALKDKCFYSFKDISPLKSVNPYRVPYRVKGRILFDLMKAMKKFTQSELRSYSLEYVAESEKLNIDKIPFKGTTANTWDNYPEVIFKRNVNDVLIMKALNDKYELVEMFNDFRLDFGCLFSEVFMNYRVVDTELLRYVNNNLALKTAVQRKPGGKFTGAIVVEPKVGAHENIAQFDFSRLYPHIMIMFNISPETYRTSDYKGECYTIECDGVIYKFIKEPIGLLPQLIQSFFRKRDEYDNSQLREIKNGNTIKAKMWYRRSFNIKGVTNSIYGVMDYPNFRLYKKECSAATAAVGRISIRKCIEIVKQILYEVIAGDTDSNFYKLTSTEKNDLLDEALKLEKMLNDRLREFFIKKYKVKSSPSELKLDKIYSRYLIMSKKNYAGKVLWGSKKGFCSNEFDFKGFEPIRSDSSNLEKELLEHITKMFLNEENIKSIKEYIDSSYEQFDNREYTPLDLAYPLQIKHRFRDYGYNQLKKKKVTIPSHIRSAIYSNLYLNTDFENGDKPRRLPIKLQTRNIKSVSKGQVGLFNEEKVYPTSYKFTRVKGDIRRWKLNNISIAEAMQIPKWFIDNIDYDNIFKRLSGKVDKVMKLIGEFNS